VRIIRLYSGTANKIVVQHRILPEHFLLIPLMMDDAWVGSDRGRHLTFLFFEQSIFNKTFKLVVKTTWGGNEVIVSTFHKIEAEHVARLKRRCATVREAKV
jgi:hypothetical protein